MEAVADFDAPRASEGGRPQAVDKDTGLRVWSVPVLDADPAAGKREKTVSVKLLAPVQPVPPSNESGSPFTPVAFEGLNTPLDVAGAKDGTVYIADRGNNRVVTLKSD